MASIGSYILSTQDRIKGEPDPKTAAAQALKLFGQQPRSVGELLSLTGWPEDFLRNTVMDLRSRELVEGTDDKLSLTDLGLKAQSIVAT